MMTATRRKKVPGVMRTVLSDNLSALMEREFQGMDNRPLALAKRADISLSSVQRALSGETGATIDTIERLALALNVSPYQLLLPELNPSNPQVVTGITSAERRLYTNFARAASKP